MTETAKIAANNAYQRQLAAADAEHAADMTELNNYVRTEQERLDDKAKAERDETYNAIVSAVQNGEYNTTADLARYLGINDSKDGFAEGSIATGLSDFQKANLLNMYRTRASDPAQTEAEALANERKTKAGGAKFLQDETGIFGAFNSDGSEGDNLEVQITTQDGSTQDLELQRETKIADSDAKAIFDTFKIENKRAPQVNEVFAYDGKFYMFRGGELWLLGSRYNTAGYDALYNYFYEPNQNAKGNE